MLSREQALAGGLTVAKIRGRLSRGDWLRVYPDVYAVAGAPATELGRLWAVWLSIGRPMWFTGVAGARLWGLAPLPPPTCIDVAVPKGRGPADRSGIRLRRCLPPSATTRKSGLPVLGLPDVLLDCAAILPDGSTLELVQETLRRRDCDEPDVRAAMARGRTGSARMRSVLAVVGDGADSFWERRLIALCRAAGLPGPTRPTLRAGSGRWFRPDLYWPGLVVEVDGWSAHRNGAAFLDDRRRQNELVLELGLSVLRYTPVDIRERPTHVVGQIRRALQRLAS